MSEPITTYKGRRILFNNGVVDVVQGETSLVDENKVAHIPEGGNVEIDNLTIIKNADDELEVPFDNNTIYRDSEDGFIKARSGGGSSVEVDNATILKDANNVIRTSIGGYFIPATWPAKTDNYYSFTENAGVWELENSTLYEYVDRRYGEDLMSTNLIDFTITHDSGMTQMFENPTCSKETDKYSFYCVWMDNELHIDVTPTQILVSSTGFYTFDGQELRIDFPESSDAQFSTIDGRVIPVDNTTINLNNGSLHANIPDYYWLPPLVGPSSIGPGGMVSLQYDHDTLGVNGSGELYAKNSGGGGTTYTAGRNINIDSENVISAEVPDATSDLTNDSGFITINDVPRYFGGIGIDVIDDEEISVRYDENFLDAPYAALTIKDGVLPKYIQEPGTNQNLLNDDTFMDKTQGRDAYENYTYWDFTDSTQSMWSFLENTGHDKTYTLAIPFLSVAGDLTIKGTVSSVSSWLTPGTNNLVFSNCVLTDNGASSYDLSSYGPIVLEFWASNSSYPNKVYLYIPTQVLEFFQASPNSLDVTTTYPGEPEIYVDLGSQLGTGWEQDREYTVKFKNGKLYLS